MASIERYRPSPIVVILSISRFVGGVAAYMVLPFIAVRMVSGGYSLLQAGIAVGVGPLISIFASLWGGILTDGVGRRKTMILGHILQAAAMVGFAFTGSVWGYSAMSALVGVARAVSRPASRSVVADVTTPQERPEAYGYLRVAMNVGAAIGPVIGAFLILLHPRVLFLSSAGIDVLILLMIIVFIPETGRALKETSHREVGERLLSDRVVWLYILGTSIQFGTYMLMESLFPAFLRSSVPGGLHLYAAMTLINTAMVATLQIWMNRRWGKRPPGRIFLLGCALFGLAYLLFAFLRWPPALLGVMVVFTLGEMLVFVAGPTFEASLSEEATRGRYFGVLSLSSLGPALWPVWVGGVMTAAGAKTAFVLVAAVVVVGGWILHVAAARKEIQVEPVAPGFSS